MIQNAEINNMNAVDIRRTKQMDDGKIIRSERGYWYRNTGNGRPR